MTEVYLHGRQLHSVFELLGDKENDITFSVGWALSRCESFLKAVVADLFPNARRLSVHALRLQEHLKGSGITDIEVCGPDLRCIIEAKRGWNLPSRNQLKQYAARLRNGPQYKALVVMSECSPEYARQWLPETCSGICVHYRSWKGLEALAARNISGAVHSEKGTLEELRTYLRSLMTMQNHESNMVFVVSLGAGTPRRAKTSWIDIVEKKRMYFHPYGRSGWPKEPPNYLGFRYHGRLQSIYHVESYEIVTEFDTHIPEINWGDLGEENFLYRLGKAIRPTHEVRTGRIFRNGRVWAMIDTLLTCKTISQARDLTQKRLRASGDQ